MQLIEKSTLSSIAGGRTEYRRMLSPVLASIAHVSARARDATPSAADAYDETVLCCNQHLHQPVTPKNGDRNALGQQYSWGTWWDDMH